jgi:glycosyltransferase involved in cell wall biosynthesis
MKIAIQSPYLDTLGGGERYILTIAEHLSKNHEVTMLWDGENIVNSARERLNIDLSKVKFYKNIFKSKSLGEKYSVLKDFEVCFVVSDGSIPIGLSKKNILHFQVPFKTTPKLGNSVKLLSWKKIIVNSAFTKNVIDKSYGVKGIVLYPPVDIESIRPLEKKNVILSVGRFFSPLHDKKQNILIDAFKKMKLKGWRLVLAGGVDKASEDKINNLKKSVEGKDLEILPNISYEQIKKLYGEAKIYWHAAGFGEDEEISPEKVEHFGISTVEAMAGGAVPIVVPQGGQKEIVDENKNGLNFMTIDELILKTNKIIENENLRNALSKEAIIKSKIYSKENFCLQIDEIIK